VPHTQRYTHRQTITITARSKWFELLHSVLGGVLMCRVSKISVFNIDNLHSACSGEMIKQRLQKHDSNKSWTRAEERGPVTMAGKINFYSDI